MFVDFGNCLIHNENNDVLNENSDEVKPCINRENRILELTIWLYSYYDKHEAPGSCNTNVFISVIFK